MTSIDEYSYYLPPELIAQTPAEPRESAKLLIVPGNDIPLKHTNVGNIVEYIQEDDVVVLNNTKVFKARLIGSVQDTQGQKKGVEVFLIRPIHMNVSSSRTLEEHSVWKAIGKPGKKLLVGSTVVFADDFIGNIHTKDSSGTFEIEFLYSSSTVMEKANTYGSVPTPPYIKTSVELDTYQTAYATHIGSVAAPTAGFHMTEQILTQLRAKRVHIVEITLHVGLGTFLPIKTTTIEEHTMHSEWVHISKDACDQILQAKQEKRRIIAIGTTTVRALEGAYMKYNELRPYTGDINIFITPGFTFHIVDCLLTNFHLPKSTLLLLVSAFAGKERIRHAYEEAVRLKYRFFSFGDAMFLSKT